MRVAIVYDRVNKWGGAERVLLALQNIFPSAHLYTSVYSTRAKWAKTFSKVVPSFLQRFPLAKDKHEYYPLLMPLAFESHNFNNYDFVISVTSEAAKGVITKPSTRHICICLTPTRYLWSGYTDYFPSRWGKILSMWPINYLRKWDKIAAQRPDEIIAISSEVQKRIKKYYNREAKIIFPPVTIKTKITKKQYGVPKDFFLVVSRLVPYKKVNVAIQAFNKLNLPLVVIGNGSEKFKLKNMARENISFIDIDENNDRDLAWFYKNCRALIFPQNEDFGLTAIECQVFGKPIIAYKAGGALDTVIDGKTGIFFLKQNQDSLIKAVETFSKMRFNDTLISQNAQRFSEIKFKKEILRLINGR